MRRCCASLGGEEERRNEGRGGCLFKYFEEAGRLDQLGSAGSGAERRRIARNGGKSSL
jgi:hypothetical protein